MTVVSPLNVAQFTSDLVGHPDRRAVSFVLQGLQHGFRLGFKPVRNVAVHPEDRYLLGMKWQGQFFMDLALPFGLRSAPFIFNSIADMVEWIIINRYNVADLMHYLDDFLTAGPAHSNQCAYNLQTALAICRSLGLPLHPGKCMGPSTCLTVLGIELDSVQQVAHLPAEKLAALKNLIQLWWYKRWCTRRQLESLVGHLHHAAKVV